MILRDRTGSHQKSTEKMTYERKININKPVSDRVTTKKLRLPQKFQQFQLVSSRFASLSPHFGGPSLVRDVIVSGCTAASDSLMKDAADIL